tara:strand:+ start:1132 stop:2484 length:1353 start_codon:yes stop_codon:yes gene_type:complete
MATFVAKPNQFALLANAFSGAAKGAQDYAQITLKRDQMAQQQSQFDEQLALNLDKLDEQIRQFDVGTEEHARIQNEANTLRATLEREGFTSAERRTQITAGTQRAIAREGREYNQRLQERNFSRKKRLDAANSLGAEQLGPKPEFGVISPEEYDSQLAEWGRKRDQIALDFAGSLNLSEGPVSDAELRIAQDYIENYGKHKSDYGAEMLRTAQYEAAARGHGMPATFMPSDPYTAPRLSYADGNTIVKKEGNNIVDVLPQPDQKAFNTWARQMNSYEAQNPVEAAGYGAFATAAKGQRDAIMDLAYNRQMSDSTNALADFKSSMKGWTVPQSIKDEAYEAVASQLTNLQMNIRGEIASLGEETTDGWQMMNRGSVHRQIGTQASRMDKRAQGMTDQQILQSEQEEMLTRRGARQGEVSAAAEARGRLVPQQDTGGYPAEYQEFLNDPGNQ